MCSAALVLMRENPDSSEYHSEPVLCVSLGSLESGRDALACVACLRAYAWMFIVITVDN